MHITVIGAGAWGTAMALAACQHPAQHSVCLHARDAQQAQTMREQKQNARYLPGIALPEVLHISSGPLEPLWGQADAQSLFIIARCSFSSGLVVQRFRVRVGLDAP